MNEQSYYWGSMSGYIEDKLFFIQIIDFKLLILLVANQGFEADNKLWKMIKIHSISFILLVKTWIVFKINLVRLLEAPIILTNVFSEKIIN